MMSSPNHDDLLHFKIPLENILIATNNFDEKNFWVKNDNESHYRGQLLWSGELIDIHARRLEKSRTDREQLFGTEISMLSTLKHKNLVSFVGFCDENDEKIIIIKLETRGGLGNYLSDPILLTWVRRLEICVGLANALSYIHYDEPRDFSIEASQRQPFSFIVIKLEHMNGYEDPTYIETKSVNHKSDMYSFGIVMFELLCGRKAVIDDDQDNNKYLASVAVAHYREKKLDEIIDWDLWNQMDSQSFNIFAEIAYDCLHEEPLERPNIGEIVMRLKKALEFQQEHHNAVRRFFSSIFLS
ncbi:kinase-like domain, phloem protein 2-like protein [Tanacetum coccineum]